MKKLSLYAILLLVLWIMFYSYRAYEDANHDISQKNNLAIANFKSVENYLEKHYKWNYPVPSWDLILLDKTKKMIHLTNRNTPLNQIKNLSIIQWTTCQILKNDKKFNQINYDPRFSIIDKKTKKVLFKKCFTYSVTKDRKHFQIWSLTKNDLAMLAWDLTKSITKSYDSPVLVKNWSEDFLPYSATKLSPVVEVKNLWNSKLTINVSNDDVDRNIVVKNGVNQLLTWNISWKYNISITWTVWKNTQIKFVSTDGSIVYIRWDKNTHKVNFALKNYSVNWNKLNYFVETWRFIASIVKLWPDKNMSVNHNWTTLVIRWTKFTIDANKNTFDTFLSLWHIVQKIWNQSVDLTMQRWFSLLKNNHLVKDMEKIKQLAWFTIYSDILNQNVWEPRIFWTSHNLTWINRKRIPIISYNDWQNFSVIKLTKQGFIDKINKNFEQNKSKYFKECNWKNGCVKLMKYKDAVNNICENLNLWKWIDITKLYYILKNNWLKKFSNWKYWYSFSLNKTIAESLNITNNTILLTSREAWVNWSSNINQRFTYFNNNWKVWTFLLQWLVEYPNLYYKNINNVMILCDNE